MGDGPGRRRQDRHVYVNGPQDWHYASGVERTGLGTLECPELFQLDLDGDPSKRTWVLAASANGSQEGFTTGVAYWTGEWDGTRFTPSGAPHQWLDAGSDFYAAVTWDDPRLTESQRMSSRHAIGWLNNWAYARQLPTEDWHGGADSMVRDIRLETVEGKPTLVSNPTAAMQSIEGPVATTGERRMTPDGAGQLPAPEGGAYRLDVTLERTAGDDGSEARIELGSGGGTFATVGYDFAGESAFISREADAAAAGKAELGPDYRATRRAVSPARDGKVELSIFVDHSSVEVFVNGGEKTMTSLVFPAAGDAKHQSRHGRGHADAQVLQLQAAGLHALTSWRGTGPGARHGSRFQWMKAGVSAAGSSVASVPRPWAVSRPACGR